VADELYDMGFTLPATQNSFTPQKPGFLSKEISRIEKKKDELLAYRDIQGLHLTEIQAKILEKISDFKLQEASLRDLTNAYKTLKDKELVMDGKPSEIKGLVGYLIELEQEESDEVQEPVDVTPTTCTDADEDTG
jgi:hypothetical protein